MWTPTVDGRLHLNGNIYKLVEAYLRFYCLNILRKFGFGSCSAGPLGAHAPKNRGGDHTRRLRRVLKRARAPTDTHASIKHLLKSYLIKNKTLPRLFLKVPVFLTLNFLNF